MLTCFMLIYLRSLCKKNFTPLNQILKTYFKNWYRLFWYKISGNASTIYIKNVIFLLWYSPQFERIRIYLKKTEHIWCKHIYLEHWRLQKHCSKKSMMKQRELAAHENKTTVLQTYVGKTKLDICLSSFPDLLLSPDYQ